MGGSGSSEMNREELIYELTMLKARIIQNRPAVAKAKCVASFDNMTDKQLKVELQKYEAIWAELQSDMTSDLDKSFRHSRLARSQGGSDNANGDATNASPEMLLGYECAYGLNWDQEWVGQPSGPKCEAHRKTVREGTRKKVAEELGLRRFGDPARGSRKEPPFAAGVTLFSDQSAEARRGSAAPGGNNLLGRYDVVAVRAYADFDKDWKFMKGRDNKKEFFVLHAAALNIGESDKAADYPDFSTQQGLDEESYIESMGHILDNVVTATKRLRGEHLVFFPFGMGAFIRHLRLLDSKFGDDFQMQRLRRRVANRFVDALSALGPTIEVHTCLQFGDEEAQRNADAFVRAFAAAGEEFRSRVTLWPEGDCLQLAHNLAGGSEYVVLVNGANRQMIGNHWFAGHARRAIDENLHRRSWSMSALSYLLNNFGERDELSGCIPERDPEELQRNVEAMGGRTVVLRQ